ncbi:unnamed protein product [Caenorhabditis auriculariae]|uniref:Protein kinase domain-containing protein n=1 Tax=Caenorhabditis auriculariae TaxID=2777116 RepID=A0A8S1GXK6_9PELO|nr:unnamed protein product [Caenorhabditis auriculariae]
MASKSPTSHPLHSQPSSSVGLPLANRTSVGLISYNPFLTTEEGVDFDGSAAGQFDFENIEKVTKDLLHYMETCKYPFINDVNCYEKLQKIGQGTFGEVFKARCKKTGRLVALKKILMENEKEGFPITALREVKTLQQLKHPNITDLIEVCCTRSARNSSEKPTFYLVSAFCDHDLAGLVSNHRVKLSAVHVKTMMKHLLSGLDKLHRMKILHRDMKAANVLVSHEGVLKLADFGLARPFIVNSGPNPKQLYTNRVVTLWYRPPELLLGSRQYDTTIDVWGVGCIMAELFTRVPIMQGETEQRQLYLINQLCGSINPEVWPEVDKLPLYKNMASSMPPESKRILKEKLVLYVKDEYAMNLLEELLTLDPSKRPTADKAIYHTYFYKQPEPKDNISDLIRTIPNSLFEFTTGRGAHANRGRGQHHQRPQQGQRKPQNVPAGQFRDMIF